VTGTIRSISLCEWDTLSPATCEELKGFFPDGSSNVRNTLEQLSERNLLSVKELRHGLEIQAFSYVGRVRIGDLNVTVLPKIRGNSLLRLIRYAYGGGRFHLVSDANHQVDQWGFEDLLISQLNTEIRHLTRRGLLRSYVPKNERLVSPRGRIDVNQIAVEGGIVSSAIPCIHHPRTTDTLLNRVLLGGLKVAASIASEIELRRESRQLASMMQEQVSVLPLDSSVLTRAMRQMNRLTTAYDSALMIIELLIEAQGISLQGKMTRYQLPGFLFDMNTFFQALLSRFLRENLEGFNVRDEYSLKNMLKYNPEYNPQQSRPPTPRADYVIEQRGVVRAILDAKYRDLWRNTLPREMLYQLVIYAISHSKKPQSAILYPSTDSNAKEARIDVADVQYGKHIGQVCTRPVYLPGLLEAISDRSIKGRSIRKKLAFNLAFGTSP
jgi:5-methylcytosine-specific restriction enzyme subunit McrC